MIIIILKYNPPSGTDVGQETQVDSVSKSTSHTAGLAPSSV